MLDTPYHVDVAYDYIIPPEMKDAVAKAVNLFYDKEKWTDLTKKVMNVDFSWSASADKYLQLYNELEEEY